MIAPQVSEIGPAGLDPSARATNRRKATVKIQRNPLLRLLSMILISFFTIVTFIFK